MSGHGSGAGRGGPSLRGKPAGGGRAPKANHKGRRRQFTDLAGDAEGVSNGNGWDNQVVRFQFIFVFQFMEALSHVTLCT